MIAALIYFYYAAIGLVVLIAFAGYLRGVGKSIIRLICLAFFAAVSFPLANLLSYPASGAVMDKVMNRLGETLSTVASANPELLFTVRNVVSSALIPILTAVIFAVLWLLSLIYFDKLSEKIIQLFGKKAPKISEKATKTAGTCVGAISGILVLFVLFTPVAFASSILQKTPTESLEAIDTQYLAKAEEEAPETSDDSAVLKKRGSPRSRLRLTPLKSGIAVFSDLSEDYMIYGFEESVQTELSNLLTAAGDGFASYNATLEETPDGQLMAYLNTVAAIGANTEHSELITSLVKGASRAVGNLDPQFISEMLSGVPGAELIGNVLPGIFAAIADTPDEDIPGTFEAFFGVPPVEPARTKELREKAEKEALTEEIDTPDTDELTEPAETEPTETEVAETAPPKTEPPATQKPTTQAPSTQKPTSSTSKPVTSAPAETSTKPSTSASDTTKTPVTTKAPETAKSPETTKAPTTTKAPVTTKAPETTKAPTTQKEPTVGGNSGLLGALIGGGSVSNKTDNLTKNKALFDSIKNAAFSAVSVMFDITSEEFSWFYVLIRDELCIVLKEAKANPKMTEQEKVELLANAMLENMNEVIPPEAIAALGLDTLVSPSSMQVIAIFALDAFTIEKYPDCTVPIRDIMLFMGIAKKDIPDWVKKYD